MVPVGSNSLQIAVYDLDSKRQHQIANCVSQARTIDFVTTFFIIIIVKGWNLFLVRMNGACLPVRHLITPVLYHYLFLVRMSGACLPVRHPISPLLYHHLFLARMNGACLSVCHLITPLLYHYSLPIPC